MEQIRSFANFNGSHQPAAEMKSIAGSAGQTVTTKEKTAAFSTFFDCTPDLCRRSTKRRVKHNLRPYSRLKWDREACLGAFYLLQKHNFNVTTADLGRKILTSLETGKSGRWTKNCEARFFARLYELDRELVSMDPVAKMKLESQVGNVSLSPIESPFLSLISILTPTASDDGAPITYRDLDQNTSTSDDVLHTAMVASSAVIPSPRILDTSDVLVIAYMAVWNPTLSTRELVDKLCILAGRTVEGDLKDSLAQHWHTSLQDFMFQNPCQYQQVIDIAGICDGQATLLETFPSTSEWLGKLGISSSINTEIFNQG